MPAIGPGGKSMSAAFKDARLGRRFSDLLRRLSEGMGGSMELTPLDRTRGRL